MDIDESFQIAKRVAAEPLPIRPAPLRPTDIGGQVAERLHTPNTEDAFRVIRSIVDGNLVADSQSIESVVSALCVVVMHIADPTEVPFVPSVVQCSIERGTRSLDEYLAEIERREVLLALEAAGQNATQAAKLLGISYRSMRYRLENLGID